MAARLIGPQIVQPEALRMVQERSGSALFVTRGPKGLTGVLALIPLSSEGLNALESGRFDSLAPQPAEIAMIGQEPEAIYVWGIAAIRKMAGAWLSNGLLAVFDEATPHLPYFARAATSAGEHLLLRVGFAPHPGPITGLLRRAPALTRRVAA